MKKSLLVKIFATVLCLCLCFNFFACGKRNSASESGSNSSPQSSSQQGGSSTSQPNSEPSSQPSDPNQQPQEEPLIDFTVEVEEGREVRVMQITDIQTIDGSQQRYQARIGTAWVGSGGPAVRYRNQIRQVVEKYDPDLIIMTGDNVYGEFDDSGSNLLELVEFMDSLQIPWAPILGNHDAETNLGVDWQCAQYENSEYCLFKQRELTGNGNYTVGISQGGTITRVFYMLDSNGAGNLSQESLKNGHTISKFQGFGQDQIDWYTSSVTRLKQTYPNVKLSFCFHIAIQAFKDAAKTYGYTENILSNPINLDEVGNEGDFGVIGNTISSWDTDNKVWNGLKNLGVDSIFCGHEHRNSFSIVYQGVRLTFGQKSSTYDTINYVVPSTGEIKGTNPGNGVPLIGGTCIDLAENGEIADSYITLYDKDDPNFEPEVDTSNITVPTVDNISDTRASYRGNEFTRYTLESLGLQNATLADGFSTAIVGDAYSFKFRVKTGSSSNYASGNLRVFFMTEDGKRNDLAITLTSTYAIIGGQTVNLSLKASTEYDLEVGILKLYQGKTAYIFLKINDELSNRWCLTEITEIKGNYLYVMQSGKYDLCEFVK